MSARPSFVVAIDGPVAAGKGTIAKRLAGHFGFRHLDTGALYRAAALRLLNAGGDPDDPAAAAEAAASVSLAELASPLLRNEQTGMIASKIAPYGAVRAALLKFQRDFAASPPEDAPGAVLEGRDTTTVICPDADLKIFITASDHERGQRRYDELLARGEAAELAQVLADLRRRDRQDSERAEAPLKQAADAHLLDTTNLAIDSAFDLARHWIEQKYQP